MADWIIGLAIAGAMVLAVRKAYKDHQKGACSGGCPGCSGHCGCQPPQTPDKG